jgi:hypothetical protein
MNIIYTFQGRIIICFMLTSAPETLVKETKKIKYHIDTNIFFLKCRILKFQDLFTTFSSLTNFPHLLLIVSSN